MTTEPIEDVRCSATPLAFKCPGSIRAAKVPVSDAGYPARLGTAAHEVFRALAESGAVEWHKVDDVAAVHDVKPEDLRMLAGMATKLWPAVKDSFVHALTEAAICVDVVEGVTLTGHLDVLSAPGGTVARCADWKTGRKDHDYSQQMRAYAALVLLDDMMLDEVTVTILWVRDQEIENYTMTRRDLVAWTDALTERVIEWDGIYHPGPHCGWCKRSHECTAANALARRDVAAFTDRDVVAGIDDALATMPPAELIALHRKTETVARLAGRVKDAIKKHVLESTGVIEAEGVRLVIDTYERRDLDPIKAWGVLEETGFVDHDFAECIDLHISKVNTIAAMKAGRGNGAAAIRALAAKLEEAGAVRTREINTLKEKRTP